MPPSSDQLGLLVKAHSWSWSAVDIPLLEGTGTLPSSDYAASNSSQSCVCSSALIAHDHML